MSKTVAFKMDLNEIRRNWDLLQGAGESLAEMPPHDHIYDALTCGKNARKRTYSAQVKRKKFDLKIDDGGIFPILSHPFSCFQGRKNGWILRRSMRISICSLFLLEADIRLLNVASCLCRCKDLARLTRKSQWNNAVTKRQSKMHEDQVLVRRVTVKL